MADCSKWLSRPNWCRRHSQPAYIYLYSPTMSESSSSSSSSSHCFVCILFALCLASIVSLAVVLIYHLNSNDLMASTKTVADIRLHPIAKKRQLPDFVNVNIDPCEYFYEFVCDKWTRRLSLEQSSQPVDEREQQWTRVRHAIHDKLMVNISEPIPSSKGNSTLFTYQFYQSCEQQSPAFLIDELERYFANLSHHEPYGSYLTLFNRTNTSSTPSSPLFLAPNPFFRIQAVSSNASTILRVARRPLPSAMSIFPNLSILNRTALNDLTKFDEDYSKLLSAEKSLLKPYEQSYHQDSLIVKRILLFPNYHQCLPSLQSASTPNDGLKKLVQLLNHFLQWRLRDFNTEKIDNQIRILEKLTDNHTLVDRLQRILQDLRTIDKIILRNETRHKQYSCVIHLLDQLLDKRIKADELESIFQFYSPNQTAEYFTSDDWPALIMTYDRLLRHASPHTLINFAFLDYYRHLIYPYYQPHVQQRNDLHVSHDQGYSGYTYRGHYPNISCLVSSCFDILHCYHPSLLNELVDNQNQTFNNLTKASVQNLIDRFVLLTEQSDRLNPNEKRPILNELNQIQIRVSHPPAPLNNHSDYSSYLQYVQFLASIPYDRQQRAYYVEPIYFPHDHVLYVPHGFFSLYNHSLDYHVIRLLLKIIREHVQVSPYHIDCLLKSTTADDDDPDSLNGTPSPVSDEHLVYLFIRSKFVSEQKIVLDEYLWPFMSANSLMKRFLIDYAATNYCQYAHGYDLWLNNTYMMDDVHLIFNCQRATSIKQSKCTLT